MDKDHLEILLEDIRGKFDLVLEGHDAVRKEIRDTREELCEKINSVDFKVETLNQKIDGVRDDLNQKIDGVHEDLNQKIDGVRDELGQKIDAVASDLAAHRRDTEAHPSVYKVKENK
jgi:archaellum component FlaC